MRARSAALLVGIALSACDTTAPRTITGRWEGSVTASTSIFQFSAELVDNGGTITGVATITGPGSNCGEPTFEVAGTRQGSVVALTFTCPAFTPFLFDATLTKDGRALQGTLQGSGFDGSSMSLTKRN